MLWLDRWGVSWEETLLEDFGLKVGFVDKGASIVLEWWEGVDLMAIVGFHQAPDVAVFDSMVESLMCLILFGPS